MQEIMQSIDWMELISALWAIVILPLLTYIGKQIHLSLIHIYYYQIEYNTTSGRKKAYAKISDITKIGNGAIDITPEEGIEAAMAEAASVYSGPSSKIYASIGSVSAGEVISILHKEDAFYYIKMCIRDRRRSSAYGW